MNAFNHPPATWRIQEEEAVYEVFRKPTTAEAAAE